MNETNEDLMSNTPSKALGNPCAPVAIFAYRRPNHLKQVFDSLSLNPESDRTDLIVYSDGPKCHEDNEAVCKVRRLAHTTSGFKSIRVVEREHNLGLSRSIISGVSELLNDYGYLIVLEDDTVVSPCFLEYMNTGLRLYANSENVASIHGYCYPLKTPSRDPFFIRGADCWGWATWERAWKIFNPDGQRLLNDITSKKLQKKFDLDGSYPYTKMLQDQIIGNNDSWAIRWHASAYLADMLTLYPAESFVSNIGHDGSGSHCGLTETFEVNLATKVPDEWPEELFENLQLRKEFVRYFNSLKRHSRLSKLQERLKRTISTLSFWRVR